MTAEDTRHGTVAGYNRIPCRDECCRLAMARYKKRWAWDRDNGRQRITSTRGTRRRIEALNWLGWSRAAIAEHMGMHATNMTRLLTAPTMTTALAQRFADCYDDLSMTLPTGNPQAIAAVRNRARRHGYAPPLAWDDIDHDDAPKGLAMDHKSDLDPVVVQRILNGDWQVPTTPAERTEVIHRWQAAGVSNGEIARRTGWNVWRLLRSAS